jgi:hypothetical protein
MGLIFKTQTKTRTRILFLKKLDIEPNYWFHSCVELEPRYCYYILKIQNRRLFIKVKDSETLLHILQGTGIKFSLQYLPGDFIKSYMCFTLTTDFLTVWNSWSCFLLFSGPPFSGMALRWKHYQNQVHTQLSPCADPHSGNALTLGP